MSGRIRNPTELMQMSEEVQHMKARFAEEEDAELKLMEDADAADHAVREATEDLEQARRQSAAEEPGLRHDLVTWGAELAEVETERDAIWEQVPKAAQTAYSRMRIQPAVSQVVNGQCSACHVTVTSRGMQMLRTEVALDAAAPAAHEGKVQCTADGRTCQRYEPADPLFGCFRAKFRCQAFRDAGGNLFENLFFGQILAVIDARGGCGRFPHFDPLIASVRFETVKQSKPLNQTQGNHREQAGIRKKGDHTAQAESRAFREGQALCIADQSRSDGIQPLNRDILHAGKIRDPDAMLVRKVAAEFFGVDLDGTHSAEDTKPQKAA